MAMADAAPDLAAIQQHMTLADWLDDLTVRFLLNLPPAELSSVPRLCFQVEEAQWYYEDFIRPLNPSLPSLNLRAFLLTLFQHCPLLSGFHTEQHVRAYEEFMEYKTRVPVRGAILMNDSLDKVLLVKGWKKGSSWSFPRGKINKEEDDLDCAIREVYEETGFDATSLVDENRQQDGHVKAIDVTMKEQHMKLFVLRGVSMHTQFEPRTRKEISGIQWYNVKDLPGFNKQRGGVAGVGQGEAQNAKFYMVAPFLGQLKKWIGQQRRAEAGSAQHGRSLSATNNALQAAITEDEGETEPELAPDGGLPTVDRSSEELKKLLSVGGPSVTHQPPAARQNEPEHAAYSRAQTNNLLAMLKGSQPSKPISGSLPHAPMEQIDPMIPQREPQTPQPQHPREPSYPQMPHFVYSPQRLQEQQRYYSLPNQSFNQPPHHQHQPQPDISHMPLHGQQMMLPLQQRPGSLPDYFPQEAQRPPFVKSAQSSMRQQQSQYSRGYGPSVGGVRNNNWQNQPFEADDRPMRIQRPHLASPMHSFAGQRPQSFEKPIGSDPSMPEASKFPQPNLPPHTQLLLDSFKSGRKVQQGGPSGQDADQQRHNSQQASALLDLFRKPSGQDSHKPVTEELTAAPASPAVSDVTVKPRKAEKKATLGEITRTLPARPKTKSPHNSPPPAGANTQTKSSIEPEASREPSKLASIPQDLDRPKSTGNLYDPAKPMLFVRASSQSRKQEPPKASPKSRLRHNVQSPRQAPQPTPKTQPTPQFSILQRPSTSRSPVPQSPLRNESAGVHLDSQVLRRQGDGFAAELIAQETPPPPFSEGKKNDLLSLFNRAPGAPTPALTSSPPAQASVAPPVQPQAGPTGKDALLGLFSGKAAPVVPPAKTPEPPPTPQLKPDVQPSQSRQGHRANGGGQQQLLLSMFSRPGSASGTRSPGTPISPFTLGTPLTKEPPAKQTAPEPRSRLGSMHSVTSNGTASGQQTPGSATPTETNKGFLLQYLNGVLEQEGYRGAKR